VSRTEECCGVAPYQVGRVGRLGGRSDVLLAGILVLIAPPQRAFNSFGDHLIEVILVVAFALTLVARAFMLYKVGATAHWEQQAPY